MATPTRIAIIETILLEEQSVSSFVITSRPPIEKIALFINDLCNAPYAELAMEESAFGEYLRKVVG